MLWGEHIAEPSRSNYLCSSPSFFTGCNLFAIIDFDAFFHLKAGGAPQGGNRMPKNHWVIMALASAVLAVAPSGAAHSQQTLRVYQAAGPQRTTIQSAVDSFRAALGTLNANEPGSEG